MIEITINGNSDLIYIIHTDRDERATKIEMPCPHPRKVAQILEEILNRCISPDGQVDNISLDYIDEENKTNIGEW